MKKQIRQLSDEVILQEAARILKDLGPFKPETKRSDKWRTADQLAFEISEKFSEDVDGERVEDVLRQEHLAAMQAVEAGLQPSALIRRAVRPDLTTAKLLWGSTLHLEPVWRGFPKDKRQDKPVESPRTQNLPANSPRVFLSHGLSDTTVARKLNDDLLNLNLDVWMAEIHIEYDADIVASVKRALDESDALVGFVTKSFIASLWCQTEMQTKLRSGYPSYLVIDTSDNQLMTALGEIISGVGSEQQWRFEETHIRSIANQLKTEAPGIDLEKYIERAGQFASNMPTYLGGRPAIGYPECPESWRGPFELISLDQLAADLVVQLG